MNLLFIEAWFPEPDRDAGSETIAHHLKTLRQLGVQVSFVPACLRYAGRYTRYLEHLGIECVYWPRAWTVASFLRRKGSLFDVVVLSRRDVALRFLNSVKQFCSRAKIIFNMEDFHSLREIRQAHVEKNSLLLERARVSYGHELGIIKACDTTLCLSEREAEIIRSELPAAHLQIMTPVRTVPAAWVPAGGDFDARSGAVFIGGFRHQPNGDAVHYFHEQILPRIWEKEPSMIFHIVGSSVPLSVKRLASKRVRVWGYLRDLAPLLAKIRVSVAPLRYGAGIKGKILTSLSYGIPAIASREAVEGMSVMAGREIDVADSPEDFAAKVMVLYQNPDLWNQRAICGREWVRNHCSPEVSRRHWRGILRGWGFETR